MIKSTTNPLKGFVRLSASSTDVLSKLGPLAGLVGNWNGSDGWNLIAVPNGVNGFKLLIQNYSEHITFTPVGAPVPNRGGVEEQFVIALMYELRIIDKSTQGVLHVENGMWLNLSNIVKQDLAANQEYTLARQSSIPHGDVVIALGNSSTSTGAPEIPPVRTLPDAGSSAPLGYSDPYLNQDIPGFNVANPNEMLTKALIDQSIGNVTTLDLNTANQGGSISNIPFVENHVKPSNFNCTFWIEDVLNPDGNIAFRQLQYSQQTDLNFIQKFGSKTKDDLIMWPHVNVNTLAKE